MFLDIEKIDNKILLQCFSDSYHEQNLSWILEKFEKNETFVAKRCFYLTKESVDSYDEHDLQYISFSLSDFFIINGNKKRNIKN